MVATIISGNDRIALPDDIRQALRLEDGAVVVAERKGDDVVVRAADPLEKLYGMFSKYVPDPPLTRAQEQEAFERAVAEEVSGVDQS